MSGPTTTASEIQGLLALFGVTPEGAIAKLETTIATTRRQLDEIDTKRQPLVALLDTSLRQLALFRGEPSGAPAPKASKPAAAETKAQQPKPLRLASSREHKEAPSAPLGGVTNWNPLTIEPRSQRGPLPQAPVSVHEFVSEKLARERLDGYSNVGYRYSTGRPLRPGELDFTFNRHGYYILLRPLHQAEEKAS